MNDWQLAKRIHERFPVGAGSPSPKKKRVAKSHPHHYLLIFLLSYVKIEPMEADCADPVLHGGHRLANPDLLDGYNGHPDRV